MKQLAAALLLLMGLLGGAATPAKAQHPYYRHPSHRHYQPAPRYYHAAPYRVHGGRTYYRPRPRPGIRVVL